MEFSAWSVVHGPLAAAYARTLLERQILEGAIESVKLAEEKSLRTGGLGFAKCDINLHYENHQS